MKKIFVLIVVLLFVSSCGWWETQWDVLSNSTWLTPFSNDIFSLSIPSHREILASEDIPFPPQKDSQIELALSSTDISHRFLSNLLILSQDLKKDISPLDFSVGNYVWATKLYSEYTTLDSKLIPFYDGKVSKLYIFEAKYTSDTPKLKYLQTATVCNKKWILITFAIPTEQKDTSKYEKILQWLSCK